MFSLGKAIDGVFLAGFPNSVAAAVEITPRRSGLAIKALRLTVPA
jgi:hypothetical protein